MAPNELRARIEQAMRLLPVRARLEIHDLPIDTVRALVVQSFEVKQEGGRRCLVGWPLGMPRVSLFSIEYLAGDEEQDVSRLDVAVGP